MRWSLILWYQPITSILLLQEFWNQPMFLHKSTFQPSCARCLFVCAHLGRWVWAICLYSCCFHFSPFNLRCLFSIGLNLKFYWESSFDILVFVDNHLLIFQCLLRLIFWYSGVFENHHFILRRTVVQLKPNLRERKASIYQMILHLIRIEFGARFGLPTT